MAIDFSFTRLLQLIRRQWFENSRLYIYSVLALVGLTSLIMWCWVYSGHDYSEEFVYFFFITALYVSGFVFASFSFNALSEKTKATYWLSSPASALEKLLCVIFYSTILFTLVFCVQYYLISSFVVSYIKELVLEHPTTHSFQPVLWNKSFSQVFSAFMYGYFAIQAFYLLGSVYFSRYSFILTTVLGAALIIFFVFYTAKLSELFFGNEFAWMGIAVKAPHTDPNFYRNYELSPFIIGLLIFIAKFIWTPVFWVATWYRIKEKQV